jgi:hypothetical protein
VGDLGGKHGKAIETSFNASYVDSFVSLKEGVGSFFGNRSFVVHFANKTRIGCGNFSSLSEDVDTRPSMPSNSSTTSTSTQSNFATLLPNSTITESVASATSALFSSATVFTISTTATADAPLAAATDAPLEVSVSAAEALQLHIYWILLVGVVSILSIL